MAEPARFTAYGNRHLKRIGAGGDRVEVTVAHGRVVFTGETGVPIAWPIAALARVRVGYVETKTGRYFQTMIWQEGMPKPVVLAPDREKGLAAYAHTVRTLAAELARTRGLAHVERGTGAVSATSAPVLIGLLTLAAWAIALFVIEHEPWWGRLIVALTPTLILALVLWDWQKRKRPLRVTGLEELGWQLPPL